LLGRRVVQASLRAWINALKSYFYLLVVEILPQDLNGRAADSLQRLELFENGTRGWSDGRRVGA
jgi:hypothetical protein